MARRFLIDDRARYIVEAENEREALEAFYRHGRGKFDKGPVHAVVFQLENVKEIQAGDKTTAHTRSEWAPEQIGPQT